MRDALLLVLEAGKSGLALLPPGSQLGKSSMEVAAAEPQEDGTGGRHLSVLGGAFVEKALAMGSCKFDRSTLFDEGVVSVERERAHDLSVSSRPRVPNYAIGWDRGEE